MPDTLLNIWLIVGAFVKDPPIAAALSAMFMSSLRVITSGGGLKPKRWAETLMVGFLAFVSIPVIVHFHFEPAAGAFFGAFLGYIGIHGFEQRVDKLLGSAADIASALRRK